MDNHQELGWEITLPRAFINPVNWLLVLLLLGGLFFIYQLQMDVNAIKAQQQATRLATNSAQPTNMETQ